MSLARRREYLKAMGIDSWILRSAPPAAAEIGPVTPLARETEILQPLNVRVGVTPMAERIVIGPGTGNTLFLCGGPGEAATALAADIARSVDGEPVWSWPAQGESTPGVSLSRAIGERLFTRVLIFGPDLLAGILDSTVSVIDCAQLIWAEPIPVLLESGAARRALWLVLSANLWCAETV